MKYYYTYIVTCTEGNFAGKVYYGCHITSNLNDGYIGSGKKLVKYLKKYPTGYKREILSFYNSEEELNKAEYDLIHPHLGKDYCLNLTEGGGLRAFPGELHPFYNKHHKTESKEKISNSLKGKCYITDEGRQKISDTHKGKPKSEDQKLKTSNTLKCHKTSDETKQKISQSCKGHIPPNKGKKMSEEQKQKIRESIKKYYEQKCQN